MPHSDGSYEGYKNRSTWAVMLIIHNERVVYSSCLTWMQGQREIRPNTAKYFVSRVIKPYLSLCSDANPDDVDWTEVAHELTVMNEEHHA
jgi:hypothetical protein